MSGGRGRSRRRTEAPVGKRRERIRLMITTMLQQGDARALICAATDLSRSMLDHEIRAMREEGVLPPAPYRAPRTTGEQLETRNAEIVAARMAGEHPRAIAARFGIAFTMVNKVFAQNGGGAVAERRRLIVEAYDAGESRAAIAARMGLSTGIIARALADERPLWREVGQRLAAGETVDAIAQAMGCHASDVRAMEARAQARGMVTTPPQRVKATSEPTPAPVRRVVVVRPAPPPRRIFATCFPALSALPPVIEQRRVDVTGELMGDPPPGWRRA